MRSLAVDLGAHRDHRGDGRGATARHIESSSRGLAGDYVFPTVSYACPMRDRSLGRVAGWAEENFDGLVVLDGHADGSGPTAGNVRLALRRARLVRDQLLALRVESDQIVISAFGAEKRKHARVAVWGTHNHREQVMAQRRRSHAVFEQPAQARPGPTLLGH